MNICCQFVLIIALCKFADPDVLEPPSIAQLKEAKTYVKLSSKMEKELDTLRKKMNKVRNFSNENNILEQ